MISPKQIRISRAYLKWTVDDLSKKTGIQWARLQSFEKLENFEPHHEAKVNVIQAVLEQEGIIFIDKDEYFYECVKLKIK